MKALTRAMVVLMAACAFALHGGATHGEAPGEDVRFDVNDVTFLWPAPGSPADVQQLIAADAADPANPGGIWPQAAFAALLDSARATIVSAPGVERRIRFGQFDTAFAQRETWKLAAFRFDPSAPGGHSGAIAEFGSTPQLRVVLQPVTVTGTSVRIHDVAAHLAFSFKAGDDPPGPGGFPRAIPDRERVRQILIELTELKAAAAAAGVPTAGPLRVHPALSAKVPGYGARVRSFLERTMTADRLSEMAFVGLEPPEPWIFFGMRRHPISGAFERVRPPAIGKADAQMLTFRGGRHVVPTPTPFNIPGGGVSTHVLFPSLPPPVLVSPPPAGGPTRADIPDIIANPHISHVLNTDCVSCHTESTLRKKLKFPTSTRFAFQRPAGVSGVSPEVLPDDEWNVRNLGWFPRFGGAAAPSISMRTANESADAAAFINEHYFGTKELEKDMNGNSSPQHPPVEPVANPLTLVMNIKDRDSYVKLKAMIEHMQAQGANSQIAQALDRIGTVHFARFVFLSEKQLAVITTYDGSFERYIDAFVDDIGDVFDAILAHVDGWPATGSVRDRREEFLAFVRKHDLKAIPPFYSAYPTLKVGDIRQLHQESQKRQTP